MTELKLSPLIPFLGGLTGIVFIFLIVRSSFLVQEGRIDEAVQVGLAATALISFLYAGALIIIASLILPNVLPIRFLGSSDIFDGARDFSIGFLFFFLISVVAGNISVFNFAILNVSEGLFAETAGILGGFFGYYLITVGAPVAEEFIFFIAFPGIFLGFLIALGKIRALRIFANPILQTIIVIAITAPIFAAFHVGQAGLTAFFISAMVFRAILLGVGTDIRQKFIPFVSAGLLFAIGGHMANNIQATGGIFVFIDMMLNGPMVLFETISGLLALVVLIAVFGLFLFGLVTGRFFKK